MLYFSCGYCAVSSVRFRCLLRLVEHMIWYASWYVYTHVRWSHLCICVWGVRFCFIYCVYAVLFVFLRRYSSAPELLEPVLWPRTALQRWVNVRTTTVTYIPGITQASGLGRISADLLQHIQRVYRVCATPLSSTAVTFCQILFPSKPVVRSIEVSHAACKDEFRRNPRSHSYRS